MSETVIPIASTPFISGGGCWVKAGGTAKTARSAQINAALYAERIASELLFIKVYAALEAGATLQTSANTGCEVLSTCDTPRRFIR